MTLTRLPSPNIAGIVPVDIPHIVLRIVTKPPSALSGLDQQMLPAFSKEPPHWPAAAALGNTLEKKGSTLERKSQKNLSSSFAAFQSLDSQLGAPSDILNSGLATHPTHHKDCQEHPPTLNCVKSKPSSLSFEIRVRSDYSLKEKRTDSWQSISLIGKQSDILGG